MKLTKIIFAYWTYWMKAPDETVKWALSGDREGLGFYDWHLMTFWYALNHEWYKMNDKMFSYTGCEDPYVEPRDFTDWLEGEEENP